MRDIRAAVVFVSLLMSCGLAIGSEVAFDFIANTSLIVVPVTINGHGPYRFLLDTGASTTILSAAVADNLKIPLRRRAAILTAGRTVDVSIRAIRTLNVGGAQLVNIAIAVGDIDLMRKLKVDGLLGTDYLRRFKVDIDYLGKVLKIEPCCA
jgi:predicted aspartyl protease